MTQDTDNANTTQDRDNTTHRTGTMRQDIDNAGTAHRLNTDRPTDTQA